MPLESIFPWLSPSDAATLKKHVAYTPLEGWTSEKLASKEGRILEDEIRTELGRVLEKLPENQRHALVPDNELEVLVTIGTAYMDRVIKECIVLQNRELLRTSDFTNVQEQKDAFDIFKAVGFVMCDADWRALVLIAARSVLCRPVGDIQPTQLIERMEKMDDNGFGGGEFTRDVSFQPRTILDLKGVIRRSGVNPDKIEALTRPLVAAGYFDDKPLLTDPVESESEKVRRVAERMNTFEGQWSWRVQNETVAAYIQQFPPRLRTPMLDALCSMVFFDAAELRNSLLSTIVALKHSVDVTALSPNSGNYVRMKLEQEVRGQASFAHIRFRKDLREVLADNSEDPIVLVDDNISSATQARAQFMAWANKPRAEWPSECQEEDGISETPLSEAELSTMQRRPIHVVVCAARQTADDSLRPIVEALGFNYNGVSYGHKIEASVTWQKELRKHLTAVGTWLIAWAKYRKRPTELSGNELQYCQDRAFGYGNVGGLVATASNVPTATVTAVWCPGIYSDSPWMPLMVRRDKLRHLVIG